VFSSTSCAEKIKLKSGTLLMQLGQNDDQERFIDENLRRVYEETVDEGIPDKFKDLLKKLKDQEKNNGRQQ
jgi:hypothetical protein